MGVSNLKIGTRLGSGFALMLVVVALTTGVGIWRLHEVATTQIGDGPGVGYEVV